MGTLGLASLGSAYETYEPGELVPVYANKVMSDATAVLVAALAT